MAYIDQVQTIRDSLIRAFKLKLNGSFVRHKSLIFPSGSRNFGREVGKVGRENLGNFLVGDLVDPSLRTLSMEEQFFEKEHSQSFCKLPSIVRYFCFRYWEALPSMIKEVDRNLYAYLLLALFIFLGGLFNVKVSCSFNICIVRGNHSRIISARRRNQLK